MKEIEQKIKEEIIKIIQEHAEEYRLHENRFKMVFTIGNKYLTDRKKFKIESEIEEQTEVFEPLVPDLDVY